MTLKDRLVLVFATGFGSGYSPVAPGTVGTVAALVVVVLLSHTGLPARESLIVLFGLTFLGSIVLGAPAERLLGRKDPPAFVLDEFAGLYVALLTLRREWPSIGELAVAFFLFRLFDVAKPMPARQLQNLGGGPGIVLDDVAAGLYAWMGVYVYRQLLENPL